MAKRNKTAPVRDASDVRELADLLAVTGDDPDTLLMLIAMCDRIIARRPCEKIDTRPLSVT